MTAPGPRAPFTYFGEVQCRKGCQSRLRPGREESHGVNINSARLTRDTCPGPRLFNVNLIVFTGQLVFALLAVS
jgi:hypothetical protein